MGKAIQHPPALCQPGHGQAVVFLIQEKAGLLTVFHVHGVENTVFADLRDRAFRRVLAGQREPSLVLFQALQGADGHVVALKQAVHGLAVLLQHLHQQEEQ